MARTNIYPNKRDERVWPRLVMAWRLVFKGEYYPAPYDWYEKLYPIVSDEYSHFAEMAVEKSELDHGVGIAKHELKRKEALQWMRIYAAEAKKSGDIQPWVANFLVEWWVARKRGML